MLSNLELKARYVSTRENIGRDFYDPILSESIKYDRFSAFFSAKALACYAQGLQNFAKNNGKYRLIISNQVGGSEFNEIKRAYEYREKYDQEVLLPKLMEELSLDEQMRFSNLAYLVATGVIEIKIAYKEDGIFHDKLGLFYDDAGNVVYIHGSNNETEAAIARNYESFDVSVSWEQSSMAKARIADAENEFASFWNNNVNGFFIMPASQAICDGISSYSKGQIITDAAYLHKNAVVLDYIDGTGVITVGIDIEKFLRYPVCKMHPLSIAIDYVDSNVIHLSSKCTYLDFISIKEALSKSADKKGFGFYVTNQMESYIQHAQLNIQSRARVSSEIRSHSSSIMEYFQEYKKVVDTEMVRPLRPQQMWDSFFMYSMKSSANFSVPGAGKTAAVLGVYAYLCHQHSVKRIVVIGPKSSFISWKDEFIECFGNIKPLECFELNTIKGDKASALRFNTHNDNLFLFNYEALQSDSDLVSVLTDLVDKDTLLVFDEAHKVKSINGKRAERALQIAKNREDRYTVVLTGTPVPNSYADIYNLLNLLYPQEYGMYFGFSPEQLRNADDRMMKKINNSIQPFFCRTSKSDLGVPPADDDEIINVEATNDENQLFHVVCTAYRDKHLALLVRLLQAESCPELLLERIDPADLSGLIDFDEDEDDAKIVDYSEAFVGYANSIEETSKFKACINNALSLKKSNRPAIIWCIFKRSIQRISDKLLENGARVAVITGDVNGENREALIREFQLGHLDFLITNPQTLAESVSLHKCCHDAIYFEYSFNLAHMLQSRDRIHRLGLPDGTKTHYAYLMETFCKANGDEFSLDRAIYDRLKEKENVMMEAIDNHQIERGFTTEEDLKVVFSSI